jgi:cytochrome c-type biogenesis protein
LEVIIIEDFVANFASFLPFGYAFGAGMVTTVSPCGVAMLPAYISLHMGTQEDGFWAQSPLKRSGRALAMSGVVTLGLAVVFGLVGTIFSLGGEFLMEFIPWFAIAIGAVLILFGVYLLLGGHFYTSLPARMATHLGNPKGSGIKGFFVFGIAYAIAAMSCTLPVFLAVVASAFSLKNVASGTLQFVSFSLGMGLIIALIALGSVLFKETVNRWIRQIVPLVARVSALLLIFAGSYILYYWFVRGDILS